MSKPKIGYATEFEPLELMYLLQKRQTGYLKNISIFCTVMFALMILGVLAWCLITFVGLGSIMP